MSVKGLLPALVFAAIVIVGVSFVLWNKPSISPPTVSAVTEFMGVRLGASPSDVVLALGTPDGMTEPVHESGLARFDYVYSRLKLDVIFYGKDKDNAKAGIACTSDPLVTLLGLDNSSSEKTVIQKLGNPDSVSASNDGLTKIYSFKELKVAFVFGRGVLTHKCVTESGSMNFREGLPKPRSEKKRSPKSFRNVTADQTASAQETIGTAAVGTSTTPDAEASAALQDSGAGPEICAPNLSKEERLGRLAAFGTVRQSGEETYDAGSHRVQFVLGGLVDCY